MNLLLLSGESAYNKPWIESMEKILAPSFGQTKTIYYDHWQVELDAIDFDHEYQKLAAAVAGFGQYAIFAKSIGTVLAAKGIFEKILSPSKCVFIGPAWRVGQDPWFKNFSVPTLFITKTNDPIAPAVKLRELLEKYHVQNFKFVEIPGSDHKYDDLGKIRSLVTDFLKQ